MEVEEEEEVEVVELDIHSCPLTHVSVNESVRGNCCGIKFEGLSDGYYCEECDYFFHETCGNTPESINYPSHSMVYHSHSLRIDKHAKRMRCAICREVIEDITIYRCTLDGCNFLVHMDCAKYPPPEIIDVPQKHDHQLKLEKVESCFTCAACEADGNGYSYKCHECNLTFHVLCVKYPAEINHPSHPLHPLKLLNGALPAYTDGRCSLCGKIPVDEAFYHCSSCNFTLDMPCVLNPPPLHHHDLNIHDHKLTLMAKSISFICTICGLKGDQSPYVCLQCNFTAHNDCSGFPWVININRHNHRVSRTSLIGVVNSKCGVCQKNMDWSCGGYSCKICRESVYHTKCATRKDVTDGKEMKGEPDEDEDIEPFEVIDENTIQHFSHIEHNLSLDKSGIFVEERSCSGCAYPIYHHSFYSCMTCDFMLHESCANLPTGKRHMLCSKKFDLQTENVQGFKPSWCYACRGQYNGFSYSSSRTSLDVRCASITEPFLHQSHPHHPLFYTSPEGVCSACNKEAHHVLRCVEDDCGYILDFKCAVLPYEVKHRVDDHFLSLCYGEKDASSKYWCDICEKKTDPKAWFYTCKDCGVTLHTDCVLGDLQGLIPESEVWTNEGVMRYHVVVRNNSMSRPFCIHCKSRCKFSLVLQTWNESSLCNEYYCSFSCFEIIY